MPTQPGQFYGALRSHRLYTTSHGVITEPQPRRQRGRGWHSFEALTSPDCEHWHPRGYVQEICNATHCGRVLYLELAAASRRPLQLVFEGGRSLGDVLKDLVQLEVLRVGLAVHRLVLCPLLCRHDRAEVAVKNIKLETMILINR